MRQHAIDISRMYTPVHKSSVPSRERLYESYATYDPPADSMGCKLAMNPL